MHEASRLPSCAAAVVAVVSSLSRVITVASAQRSGTAYRESLSAAASRERAPTDLSGMSIFEFDSEIGERVGPPLSAVQAIPGQRTEVTQKALMLSTLFYRIQRSI